MSTTPIKKKEMTRYGNSVPKPSSVAPRTFAAAVKPVLRWLGTTNGSVETLLGTGGR